MKSKKLKQNILSGLCKKNKFNFSSKKEKKKNKNKNNEPILAWNAHTGDNK